jgi:glycosyltransferase involved in cell wall biosynthesis
MRFHILGIPHTASNKDYLCCAFTQKVVNMCAMLTARGHTVMHYGNALSDVDCMEHVTILEAGDVGPPEQSGSYDVHAPIYQKFHNVAVGEIERRKRPLDMILSFWPTHKTICDVHKDVIAIEAGIGYPAGHFAPHKIFESYAMMHAYRGIEAVGTASGNGWWYDAVIPNYLEPDDFELGNGEGGYLLFLGLRSIGGDGKGVHIADQIAKETGDKLIIAGPGDYQPSGDHVAMVGFCNVEKRKKLLAGAKALLAPSLFIEPFCGVAIEAMMSGTPVISTDWGAFAENNLHGVTGYRCHNFEQFTWAVKNIDRIDRGACRRWADENFSIDAVAPMYEEFFRMVLSRYTTGGWYEPNPQRRELDWLRRSYPARRWEKRDDGQLRASA